MCSLLTSVVANCREYPCFPRVEAFRLAQPERDVRWLHRLLDHFHQLLTKPVQVDFAPQCLTERCQRASSSIWNSRIYTQPNENE
jgi:hypothetical protein